jgi:HPt (histidine-containing phosphotransfer) domain-containing protein
MSANPDLSARPCLPGPGVLDPDALARLHDLDPGGKAGLVPRVLATYRQSLQRLLEQLRVACEQSDTQTQRHVVHTLKSSSASVGALTLARLCADTENKLREGLGEGLAGQLDELAGEGERVLAALRTA